MLFSEISFLYIFLPATILFYFLTPSKGKNYVLLVASVLFYAYGEPKYLLVLMISVFWGYAMGLLLGKIRGERFKKATLGISILGNLAPLLLFKYADFLIENGNRFLGTHRPLLNYALPIGISFYTFQLISYLIDVYRQEVEPQRNPFSLALYICMFPQLIAGPIVRYQEIENGLKERRHSVEDVSIGMKRFLIGLFKKVLIANELGVLVRNYTITTENSCLYTWLYAISYTLQIYYDFSGYSDMAIGLGRIFGFRFSENFNYPYISKSITEFWRRWHISLGLWFRNYVYIPLGGNQVRKIKWFRNIFIVWFLTGFWHGASWNFIVWGLLYAMLLVLEKSILQNGLERGKVWQHIYTMFFVVIGFVFFESPSLTCGFQRTLNMFGKNVPLVSAESIYYAKSYAMLFLVSILGATPLPSKLWMFLREKKGVATVSFLLESVFFVVLLLVVGGYLADGSYQPFLYFRF